MNEERDFYDKEFIPVLKKYYKKYYPELLDTAKTFEEIENEKKLLSVPASISVKSSSILSHLYSPKNYRQVPDEWFNLAVQFDEDWFRRAGKVNTVRNKAAHVIKSDKIYSELGIKGKNEKTKFNTLRKFCIQQLSDLLDITIAKTKFKKFL